MRAKKNAPWGTQQTSQIPAALLSQSKIKQNPEPQAKSVVKYLTLSPNRQSTRYISGPEHLNLSCCLWMPQGGRRSSCQARNWELYICRSGAAHLHGTKADNNTKQPIDVHLWCVNSWANRPSEPLHHPSATIVRFHLCLWARNAFETRRGDGFAVAGQPQTTWDGENSIARSLKLCLSLETCSLDGTYRCHNVTAVGTSILGCVPKSIVTQLWSHVLLLPTWFIQCFLKP